MSDTIIGMLLASGLAALSGTAKVLWDKMERLTVQVDALQAENATLRALQADSDRALADKDALTARLQRQINSLRDENRIMRRAMRAKGIDVDETTTLRDDDKDTA